LNALGGTATLTAEVPTTILKGVGVDLFSIGRLAEEAGDEVVVDEDPWAPSFRRLVISNGRAVGATVLGHHPELVAAATTAVKNRMEIHEMQIAALRRGDWRALNNLDQGFAPAGA
jgi:NAD(P)H-nitrite reductase large subunit